MKFFSKLLSLIVAALAVVFVLSNRAPAAISLWPFDVTVTAPLGLVTLGALLLGMGIGGAVFWLSMLPHHFLSRRLKREVGTLQTQIQDLQKSVLPPHAPYDLTQLPRPKARWPFWRKTP